MKCKKCDSENPDGAEFCNECGSKFELACPQCSNVNPPGSKFCNECGHNLTNSFTAADSSGVAQQPARLSEPPSLLEGERRQATIVFSDLSGYTSMNERLDPEEVEAIMSRIKKEAVRIVERHEGIVNQFVGDEVLALFGIPIAHEDDPVRAVRAATQIHKMVRNISPEVEDRINAELRMHSGISTGLVVTHLRDIREGSYGITGDTVNIGARLATSADADEIIVGPETYSQISPFFETDPLEAVTVRGRTQPLIPHRIKGESAVHTRFEAAEKLGFTEFAGREQELITLYSCLDKAVAGIGQFVTVVGEAGVGKSRLVYEFQNYIDKNKVEVWQGYCQSFWSGTNYFPFISMLSRGLHLSEEIKSKDIHEIAVSSICGINRELEIYLPFYLNLLSIPSEEYPLPDHIEGQELINAFHDAIAEISIIKSKRQPLVLILEDWQWVDQASESALKHLVSIAGTHPLMIVTVYRPIYSSKWRNWSYHTPIVLKSLDNLNSKNIVKSVFRVDHLPQELVELIITRTEGNPFFIEEVCHSLIEGGVIEVNEAKQAILTQALETLAIPDKVQAIISARLDRLVPDAKETLRIASVVGRRFERQILEKIYRGKLSLSQVLKKLIALEMIQQTRVFPEAEYWFRHALTKEVVYNSLLLQRRKVLHGFVGQIIEEIYPERIEEHVNLLQYHFSMAKNWAKAVQYGHLSAEKASKLSQFHEAVTFFDHVLKWLVELPEDRLRLETQIDILLKQERLYETLGQRDQQQKIINKLISLVQPEKDQALLAEIYMRQGDLYTQLGNYNEADRVLNDAINNWRSLSDASGESRSLRSMGFLRWHQNRYKEAIKCNEEALAIDRQREDSIAIATDLTNLGSVWHNFGDPKRSLKCLEEALKIYETKQKPVKQAFTLYSIANVYREQDILDRAIIQYQRAQEIFDQHHDRLMSSRAIAGIASIYKKQGKVQESLHLYEEVVKVTREINYRQGLSHALGAVGDLLLTLNKPRKALNYLLESTEIFVELKDRQREAEIWEKIGNIYDQNIEDFKNALNAWDKAKELLAMTNDRSSELEILEKMGQLARKRLGHPKQALRYFSEAFDIATKMGDRRKQGKLLNDIGVIEWHQKAYGDALKHYEKALEIYYELKDAAHTGLILNSLGITLHKLGHQTEALGRLREAVDINNQAGEQLLKGHGLAAIGDIYCEMGENDQALNHYRASLEIRNRIGDHKGQGWMLHSLARVYSNQDLYDKAHDCLTQAQTIAEEYSDLELRYACTRLCKQITGPP
jgi:predicted ATPase/class 3 adenylate cyclase